MSRTLLEPYAAAAARTDTPLIVTPVEATGLGGWTADLRKDGLVFCRGVRSTYRALRSMHQVATARPRANLGESRPEPAAPPALVRTPAGPIVGFALAMELLRAAGVPVAPYVVLADGQDDDPAIGDLGDALVVKLADVPHRTEPGAVRLDVGPGEVAAVAGELRAIAAAQGLPPAVAVQPMVAGHGEAFVGLQGRTDLGPVVLLGLGGVLVEVAGRVSGRLLPLDPGDAEGLVDEVAGDAVHGRLRGQAQWPERPLVDVVAAVGELWRRTGSWLGSADLNPLVVTEDGVVAFDALLVASH